MAAGKGELFFFRNAAMKDNHAPIRWPSTHAHTGSSEQTPRVKKNNKKLRGSRGRRGSRESGVEGAMGLDLIKTHCVHVQNSL